MADRLLEQGAPIIAYNGGHRAFTPGSFTNRRSELWWAIRQRFERGRLWLPEDAPSDLREDLLAPTYEVNSSGRIKVETKEQLLNRSIRSPDFADALTMCFAMDEDPTELPPEEPGPQQDHEVFIPIEQVIQEFQQLPDGY